ncbi:MAG TPA: hypothetical protein VMC07_01180 [Candidatus Omnitrophota bacterium]|nr:hypothetical protein [Candidatus Omnitrophota bacterium]
MKTEKIILKFRNGKIPIEADVMRGVNRGIGLMFSRRERAKALVFKFKKPSKMAIHSFFVFFPFIAAWTGTDGKVIETRKVKPFLGYVCPKKSYLSLVEIPLNRKYKKITDDIERFK